MTSQVRHGGRRSVIYDCLVYFVCRLTAEFENQMHITLNETAKVVSVIFPMQCFAICEGQTFKVMFQHELQSTKVGKNLLLTPAIGKH